MQRLSMPFSSQKTIAMCVLLCISFDSPKADAGPFLDWLFGRSRRPAAYPVGAPVPIGNGYGAAYGARYAPAPAQNTAGYGANYGTYYGPQLPVIGSAGAGYTAQRPTGIAAATMPPTISYVPNYRSSSYRAPVTYYRPIVTTDPNTGAQVVAMSPCTSYQYQTQRVPTFGRSALFGTGQLPPVVPPARALPTYTLPSGGIPLAASTQTYIGPNAVPSTNGYAALMPQTPGAVQGTYPTNPLGTAPYYGTQTGGCTGSFRAPSSGLAAPPGLTAPAGPNTIITPAPTFGSPTSPPGNVPNGVYPEGTIVPGATPGSVPGLTPGSIAPPPAANPAVPSQDPRANQQPALPGGFPTTRSSTTANESDRSMQSVVRQPNVVHQQNKELPAVNGPKSNQDETPSLMAPIPVPDGFDRDQRWIPPLLSEQDLTASRSHGTALASYAGQAKVIQWASFEEAPMPTAERAQTPSFSEVRSSDTNRTQANANRIRQPVSTYQAQPEHVRQPASVYQRSLRPSTDPYDSTGWQPARQ